MRIAPLIAIMLVLCGVGAFAESKQQRPSPTESVRYAAQSNYGSEKEERGSEKNPFFIKQLHPEIKDNTRNNEGKNVDNKMTPQDWSSMATALFTLILTISTIALWISTRAIAKISRDEFNATHRPQIVIHALEDDSDTGGTICSILTYINTGTTVANIIELGTEVFFFQNLTPGTKIKTDKIGNKALEPGQWGTHRIKSDIKSAQAYIEDVKVGRKQSQQRIVCIGRIVYTDSQGTRRETGFCRVYNDRRSCWLRVENSDYEYSY